MIESSSARTSSRPIAGAHLPPAAKSPRDASRLNLSHIAVVAPIWLFFALIAARCVLASPYHRCL